MLFTGPCFLACAPHASSDERPQVSHGQRASSPFRLSLARVWPLHVRATPCPSAPIAPAPPHTATALASACSTKDGSTSADPRPPHRTGPQLSPACHRGAPYSAAHGLPASLPAPPAHRQGPADRPR